MAVAASRSSTNASSVQVDILTRGHTMHTSCTLRLCAVTSAALFLRAQPVSRRWPAAGRRTTVRPCHKFPQNKGRVHAHAQLIDMAGTFQFPGHPLYFQGHQLLHKAARLTVISLPSQHLPIYAL
eukprot:351557-Chlamydomonas_euryale.AAC.30